jgi:hypothetical protein
LLRKKDKKPEEYANFNSFADKCIDIVNGWFAEMEKIKGNHL